MASKTMSTAAMSMLNMTAALLSPATAASLKCAYTMHMDTRLKKKSPKSRSVASCPLGASLGPKGGLDPAQIQQSLLPNSIVALTRVLDQTGKSYGKRVKLNSCCGICCRCIPESDVHHNQNPMSSKLDINGVYLLVS